MALFKWHHEYSVNNEELDTHHKTLFDILDRMYYSCLNLNTRHKLYSIIDEFVFYTQYHYPVEEQLMRSVGYKGIDRHIAEHKSFIDNILKIRYNNDVDRVTIKTLIVHIGSNILNHVMVEDKKYSNQLNKIIIP